MKAFYLAAGASFLMISNSYAATVKVAEGTVLLQDGHGNFKSVVFGTTSVNPGDKIVIRSGGVAVVDYGNACTVRLPAGIWTVKAAAPCNDSAANIDFTSRMNQAGPPEGGDLPIEDTASAPAADMTPWIIGGLAVAGGVGIAIAVSNSGNDKDDPAPSPPPTPDVTPTPRDLPISP
ncbi:hypothetical protein APY04_1548 [Hyphomicrobium sulfonivorans]|uniref:Uncharacterized protein n=2 Tax=Hyphomicrobium sulfonivorans TaxID=121290 RepID=A0A120CWI9_HYPSL|nr:hypothetical protein APY04_1548 [Hyphomicrobium sulfonivorans]